MTDLNDRYTSEVNTAIKDQRQHETEYVAQQLNTKAKLDKFNAWLKEQMAENMDVLDLHKTPKKIMAVGCLALMPYYSVHLDQSRGWDKFSDLLTYILPPPDSPRWEGKNISAQMYPDARRMEKDGLVEFLYSRSKQPTGIRLTMRGAIYGAAARTVGMKTLVEWYLTKGEGPNAKNARWPSVLRGGNKPRNRLAVGEEVSDEIFYHQTEANQKILDWFYDNSLQMAQRGIYTATALRNQDPKTRRNAGQITEAIVQGNVKSAFHYLWPEHKEMVVREVIRMVEGESLSSSTTELVCTSLMEGDVVENLYAYYSDHVSVDDPNLEQVDRDDEIDDLILRVVWTIVRRIVDYRMNNVRYGPYMKTAIYGPELEFFLHKMAVSDDVAFGETRDPDGQTIAYDVVIDGVAYDLKTLKPKDEISKSRPIF